jgi:hypothetical protein
VSKEVAELVARDMRESENPVESMLNVHAALELGIDTSEVSFLGDAKSSLGDAKSSLGDAKSSLGDAKS